MLPQPCPTPGQCRDPNPAAPTSTARAPLQEPLVPPRVPVSETAPVPATVAEERLASGTQEPVSQAPEEGANL